VPRLLRTLLGWFVADTMLALFVPGWITVLFILRRYLSAPPVVLAALLAGGLMLALWVSVRRAARKIRRGSLDRP